MPKKDEARAILSSLNMPTAQQSDICCLCVLVSGT